MSPRIRNLLLFALGAVVGGFAIGALGDALDLDGTATTVLIAIWVVVLLGIGARGAREGPG